MAANGRYDGFAIDLDGVVWLAREPLPGSPEAIELLRSAGHPVVFVSNDPRSTTAELAGRLGEIGAPTDPAKILTSATVSAETLARERPGAPVLAIGTASLGSELRDRGLEPLGPDQAGAAAEPEVVLVGGGGHFDFEVLSIAAAAVRAGAELWATNKDPTYPVGDGLAPGTGAIVAAIEVASGTEARNLGKPEPALFHSALEHLAAERPLMCGDSLRSDIAGASAAGLATALVLTGHATESDLAGADPHPDHVYPTLAALAEDLA